MSNFERCIEFVLDEEGGTANHPADPGGLTKYGISKRAYPGVDIGNLTLDEAKDIYRRDYWNKVHGDRLPAGLDLLVFDCAVNQGPKPAITMLQKAAGVTADSVMGGETLRAVNDHDKTKEIAAEFCVRRALRYAINPNYATFGKGWLRRLFRAFNEAQRLGGWRP